MSSEVPKKFFTVVYRVSSGDEAKALAEVGNVSVASWSHATDERDAAIAELQAVRAQWAAEVAEWKGAYEARSAGIQELLKQLAEVAAERDNAQRNARVFAANFSAAAQRVIDLTAERDSAQAEAKRLREPLQSFMYEFGDKANSATVQKARAALQPGASSHDE